MLCNGNRQEKCGGPNHLTLFQLDSLTSSSSTPSTSTSSTSIPSTSTPSTSTPSTSTSSTSTSSSLSTSSPGVTIPGWNYLGCYTDSVQARTLSYSMAVTGGPTNMTQENCRIACAQAGYIFAGVEYSGECCNILNLTYLLILKIF
jgi:WSC domain